MLSSYWTITTRTSSRVKPQRWDLTNTSKKHNIKMQIQKFPIKIFVEIGVGFLLLYYHVINFYTSQLFRVEKITFAVLVSLGHFVFFELSVQIIVVSHFSVSRPALFGQLSNPALYLYVIRVVTLFLSSRNFKLSCGEFGQNFHI